MNKSQNPVKVAVQRRIRSERRLQTPTPLEKTVSVREYDLDDGYIKHLNEWIKIYEERGATHRELTLQESLWGMLGQIQRYFTLVDSIVCDEWQKNEVLTLDKLILALGEKRIPPDMPLLFAVMFPDAYIVKRPKAFDKEVPDVEIFQNTILTPSYGMTGPTFYRTIDLDARTVKFKQITNKQIHWVSSLNAPLPVRKSVQLLAFSDMFDSLKPADFIYLERVREMGLDDRYPFGNQAELIRTIAQESLRRKHNAEAKSAFAPVFYRRVGQKKKLTAKVVKAKAKKGRPAKAASEIQAGQRRRQKEYRKRQKTQAQLAERYRRP